MLCVCFFFKRACRDLIEKSVGGGGAYLQTSVGGCKIEADAFSKGEKGRKIFHAVKNHPKHFIRKQPENFKS